MLFHHQRRASLRESRVRETSLPKKFQTLKEDPSPRTEPRVGDRGEEPIGQGRIAATGEVAEDELTVGCPDGEIGC